VLLFHRTMNLVSHLQSPDFQHAVGYKSLAICTSLASSFVFLFRGLDVLSLLQRVQCQELTSQEVIAVYEKRQIVERWFFCLCLGACPRLRFLPCRARENRSPESSIRGSIPRRRITASELLLVALSPSLFPSGKRTPRSEREGIHGQPHWCIVHVRPGYVRFDSPVENKRCFLFDAHTKLELTCPNAASVNLSIWFDGGQDLIVWRLRSWELYAIKS
jgi:hypothetical protein